MDMCVLPRTVYGGENALDALSSLLREGEEVAVFTDHGVQSSGTLDPVLQVLQKTGVKVHIIDDIPSEPTCDQVQEILNKVQKINAGTFLAVGGGSVMDVTKLCSVAIHSGAKIRDLLNGVTLTQKNVNAIMIPTTAGTGAEATPNAIVAVPEKELKVGIITPAMIPDVVILDERMTAKLPMHIAASTGVDALCHAVECYTSLKATPFSDFYALEAAKLIFTHIERACLDQEAKESREAMQRAAYYAGVAITCSGTTAVHALSYPLGGKYHIAHGVANAMLLLPVMEYNLPACASRFADIYDALGEKGRLSEDEKAQWLLKRMKEIIHKLQIPSDLKTYGVSPSDLDALVAAGMDVKRLLQNNRREMTAEAAREIYLQLL